MGFHRLKKNFTSGELSPLMQLRTSNTRYLNGCKTLKNVFVKPQGPATRRSGTRFVYDVTPLTGMNSSQILASVEQPREVEFIFNESQSYIILFYPHVSGTTRFVVVYEDGLIPDPASPSNPFVYEITGVFNIKDFQFAQSNDKMFISQSGRSPLSLNRLAHDSWNVTVITFTSMPVDWSTPNGWPETVAFYEQRLAFGGNTTRPQTIWFSKSADYYDFTTGTGTGALIFTIDSAQANNIRWLATSKQLIIGTIGDEWTLGGARGEPLTSTTVRADKQTPRGSEALYPLQIDDATVFLERLGRTVNMFLYDISTESFQITDLSILAPHLTESDTILYWTYQQTPNGIIWCVLSNGKVIAMTFQKEHNVLGWHRHDSDGLFKTVASIPGTKENNVWFVIERTIENNNKWYLELLESEFISEQSEDGKFLDSHLYYSGVPVSSIGGLSHLEGKTVDVVVDGAVQPPRTVVSGSVTLDFSGTKVLVGLPYSSKIEPELPDMEGKTGTAIGRMQRITNLDIYLYRSLGLKIQRYDSEDGLQDEEDIPFRTPGDLTGQAVPLFSGVKHISFPEGYDRESSVILIQDQPLPMTILGMVDTIEVYE